MRKLLAIAILFVMGASVYAQQEPLNTNYRFNYFQINPAAAGSYGRWAAAGSYRGDFTRFPGSPVTATASLNGVLGQRSGIGVNVLSETFGPTNEEYAQLAYAYQIPMDKSNLSIGLGAKYQIYRLNQDLIDLNNPADPAVMYGNNSLFDFSFGIMHYSKKHFVGISVPQVIQLTGKDAKKLVPHIYLSGGYNFDLKKVTLQPMAFLRFVPKAGLMYDISVKGWFIDNQLMFGAGYRGGKAGFITFMTGFNVKDKYSFSYSYDLSVKGDFQSYSWGSHEITFGLRFGKQKFGNVFNIESKAPAKGNADTKEDMKDAKAE